jgi:hypothetical protein
MERRKGEQEGTNNERKETRAEKFKKKRKH